MQQTLQKYLHIFKKLRVDRSHGVAPHKPILLLSVLQAYQCDFTTSPKVYITPELVALFKSNWNQLVLTHHDCRISYPFYYLKSEKFWTLIPKSGFENINTMGSIMKTFSNLNAAVDFALIAEDLFELVTDKRSNDMLQQFLLDEYFPTSKTHFIFSNDGQSKLFDEIEQKLLHENPTDYRQEIRHLLQEHNEEEIFLRGSLFKREIPKIYNNTCCISGMRVDTTSSVSMIDACHIVPFSVSYDDTITNGIALCPNLHRAFDRGLIAIDSDYKVIVSPSFIEGDTNYSIRAFDSKQIKLPNLKSYYPLRENFEWHRMNVFR